MQRRLSAHDFGQLAVNGLPGGPPYVQPLHFCYDPAGGPRGEVIAHLARPNPLWPALEADPTVLLSVVDDYVFVPGLWQAPVGTPPEDGVPTSFYAAVQLHCVARVVDEPTEKADLLNRQLAHFQPEVGSPPAAPDQAPYGRLLTGIRGLRLEVTEVQAKFKYAGHRPQEVRDRIVAGLMTRGGPRDTTAREHVLRRGRA
ncbi:FMN-binding negative transcriptional regulator [Streptomyces cavernae]|uniref:FMN-binding negative transcriptional regulator n=1 Tax=Streptomyces cavernae TaxID=2259034 RepID=UPI001EE4D613|nr:FMN-binding negative transcriptional regulator [Streptomyces cavernae]